MSTYFRKWSFVASVALVSWAGSAQAKGAKDDPIKRGGYLVEVGGCGDCHTPLKMTPNGPAPDMERMLSGHPEGQADPAATPAKTDTAVVGPDLTSWKFNFGVVYTRNLTPDKTGLGDWTEEQFISTLRNGKHQGNGRALLLPMPWFNYAKMTEADLKAVWAYLRSIKPIANTVPDPKVPPAVLDQFGKSNQMLSDMIKAGMAAEGGKPAAKPAKTK